MENNNKMEAITTPISTPSPAPVSNPAPALSPAPAPTPMVSTPNVQMADGGNVSSDSGSGSSNGITGFLKDLNWLEVGFSILGVSALAYVIYYYRFKLQQDKLINNELQRQIDEIKMNLQSNLKGKYKSI
jgi:hypothetical protein